MITDYDGQPLTVGAPIEGWYDGIRYTGTVAEIKRAYPGCAYRHITVRKADGTTHDTFSDAVRVLPAGGSS